MAPYSVENLDESTSEVPGQSTSYLKPCSKSTNIDTVPC